MTNYFKLNNYYKFYSKSIIVTTAIMSDNLHLICYADFTHEIFNQSESQTLPCHVTMMNILISILGWNHHDEIVILRSILMVFDMSKPYFWRKERLE